MKIEISNIPGYFPSDYSESFYVDSSKYRVTYKGKDSIIYQTPQKFKIKNDESWENRKVQSVFYDKYQISFIITESTDIDLLNVAKNILITLDSGEIHNVRLIDDVVHEKLQNSDFIRVTINYRDLKSKETINYLLATSLTDGIAKLTINTVEIYSPIYCKLDISEYFKTENSDSYKNIITSDSSFKLIRFYAYLTESELFDLKNNLSAKYLSSMNIEFNGDTYNAEEVPEIEELENDFEDLVGIILTLKYQQTVNYPFE